MQKLIKKIIYTFVSVAFVFGFNLPIVFADGDLMLEKINDCDLVYMGNSCLIEMKITNNTGGVLVGKLDVEVSYEGDVFDGEGMLIKFLPNPSGNWLGSSGWDNGNIFFDHFDIAENQTTVFVEINTHPALYSGEYTLIFSLVGTSEGGESYESETVPAGYSGGGGGGNGIPGTVTAPQKGEDGKFSFLDIPTEILEEIKKLPDTVIEEVVNFVRENPTYFEGIGLNPREISTTTLETLEEEMLNINNNQLASIVDSGIGKKISDFLQPVATSPAILVIIFILIVALVKRSFFF